MATTVLRFQCVDGEETSGEVTLYASQSSEARTGIGAGTVDVEQFSRVRDERNGSGEAE